jgi:hypothetical protein
MKTRRRGPTRKDLSMEYLIDRARKGLQWELVEEHAAEYLHISCLPRERRHILSLPDHPTHELGYLHELAHATLAEKEHHLVGCATFTPDTAMEVVAQIKLPLLIAADWFADALLMKWTPKRKSDHIRDVLVPVVNEVCRKSSDENRYKAGLAIAQAQYFLDIRDNYPRFVMPFAEILLRTDPDAPNVAAMASLVNELAAIVCPYRVEMANDRGLDVWRVIHAPSEEEGVSVRPEQGS